MTFRFIVFSEEVEKFVMELKAPPSASFLDIHRLLLRECGYTEQDNHVFLVCNDDWRVKQKIHLHDTGDVGYDEDLYLMADTSLEDLIEEEGQKIAYVFDSSKRRTFLIELVETIFSEKSKEAVVSRRKGTPPAQTLEEEEDVTEAAVSALSTPQPSVEDSDSEEEPLDDDNYEDGELDMDGFEVTEM